MALQAEMRALQEAMAQDMSLFRVNPRMQGALLKFLQAVQDEMERQRDEMAYLRTMIDGEGRRESP